ncbi:MAG: 2-oxoglutarate dehydrogenase E2 component (dihydrolipoamide succinyltransferase) [Bacteroidia bacterium]|jgi:2-oxoglutarate dehydrogenase E2 component (dihydrolipoamide succinyltransferase)
MSEYKLIMPKMGESIAEATIITWLKNEGDSIDIDEAVLEIATDKVDSEVPSMEAGILVKKLYNEGDVVAVGEAIAIISASGSAAVAESVSTEVQKTPETAIPAVAAIENSVTQAQEVAAPTLSTSDANRFYSPLVMNIARTEKISMQQLEIVPGTGQDGRVTKRDILAFVKNGDNSVPALNTTPEPSSRKDVSPPKTEETKTASRTAPAVNLNPGDEIIEMGRMRKLIADHMVMSKHTSPHVTSFVEADVTNLVNWRNKIKGGFKEREGENFTFTPIFIEAITKAIKDFPMINISVSGNTIIKHKNINVGMAAALPSGNLIVPVIKNADFMNLTGLAKTVNDLANRARNNKLKPDEIQGGTYTVTNVGTFGNILGTPIINQPQVAIMAMGAIVKKPAVIETEHGDLIGIRHKMFLSHSYDHRVVDGALGGMFVRRVADYLEQWDENREV